MYYGKNGMGKTTLLETIMVIIILTRNINYNGKNIEKLLPYERAKLGLAYVPQGREIFTFDGKREFIYRFIY